MKTKKAFLNIISQFSYEIIAMVCGLILPRFILSRFGSEYNGMISSIMQFLEYISILTLGISGSTRVAIYSAKGDINKISRLLKATQNYMRKVALFFIIYMLALAVVYPLFIDSTKGWFEIFSLVIIIGIGTFAEYFFGITNITFLLANQGKYIYNIVLIFTKISSTVISVLLIYMGCSIQIVKLGAAVCFVLGPIILNYIVVKKYKIIKNIDPDNSALKQRKDVVAHSIANTIHQYTDIFLLTIFSSVKLVSVYSVYTLALGSLRKLSGIFTNSLEGAFGELWAKKDFDAYEKNFKTLEYLNFLFVIIVFSCATVLIIPFVRLYTSGIKDVNYVLFSYAYISVISYALYCIRVPYVISVQSAGKYKETRNGAILEAIINFAISILLVKPLGLVGVTIGTLAANIIRTIQYEFYVSKNLVIRSNIVFFRKCIWCIFSFVIILIFTYFMKIWIINSWSEWIVSGIIVATISFIVILITSFAFYREELANSINLFKKMIFKRS